MSVKQEFAQLHDVLNRTLMLLDDARALVEPAGIWPPSPTVSLLDRAKTEILQARSNLHVARANAGTQVLASPPMQSPVRGEPATAPAGTLQQDRARARFIVRTAADVNRLLLRSMLPWKLPRIEIAIDTLPALEIQRAQDRITRIHNASEQQIIGLVAASAVILFGAFRIVVFHNPWTSAQDLKDFETLFFLGFLAWVAGRSVEIIWSRARLLRVLFRLRRQVQNT